MGQRVKVLDVFDGFFAIFFSYFLAEGNLED
jgi:hypothetical protein